MSKFTPKFKRGLQKQLFGFAGKVPVAQKALRLAKRNRRELNDYNEIGYISTTTPITGTLNDAPATLEIPSGAEEGVKNIIKSVRVTGWIRQNFTSILNDDYRVILLLDRNPRGTLPTATDLFGVANPAINVHKGTFDFRRFKILRSMRGILKKVAVAAGEVGDVALFDFYVKLNLVQLTQNAGNFGVANITKNAISLMLWTTAVANEPTFSFNRVVTFTDD